jgi:hypothetical protein
VKEWEYAGFFCLSALSLGFNFLIYGILMDSYGSIMFCIQVNSERLKTSKSLANR